MFSLEDSFIYYGKKIKLNLSFDAVLKTFELQKEDFFSDIEKLEMSLGLLISNYKKIQRLSLQEKNNILKTIFDNFIFAKSKNKANDGEKTFDFKQDEEYIYAAFMQAYGIDLTKDKIHWKKFMSLFKSLPEDTKMCEIMGIRSRKLPQPTKYNAEEIESIKKAKAYYALEISEEEAEKQFQQGVNDLANALKQRAVMKK